MTRLSALLVGRLAGLLLIGAALVTGVFLLLPTPEVLDPRGLAVVLAIATALGIFARFAPWDRWGRRQTLWLLAAGFGLIAAGNYYGMAEPWTFGLFFIVAFAWLGIGHGRWMSLWFAPIASVAYVVPIILRPGSDPRGATSAVITIPVCVLVAEMLAWNSAREARSSERAEALARAAAALGARLSEEDVLQTLTEEARRALEADHTVLYQVDPETGTLQRAFTSGVEAPFLELLRSLEGQPMDDLLVAPELGEGRSLIIQKQRESTLVPAELLDQLGVHSAMVIPVKTDDRLVGVLACAQSSNPQTYTREDVNLAEALAGQASAAMRNAMLYRQTLEAARRDPLTELGNRRAFHERLADEFARAYRYGHVLSLVLLDPDNFKLVNDTWGHQAGDRALLRLSQLLTNAVRAGDDAFRIGGDEFALILPETGPDGAAALAERIRRTVQRSHIAAGTGRNVTVSVGVASYPIHGSTPDELFSRADTALYEVKHAGGDAVSIPAKSPKTGPSVLFGVDLRQVIDQRGVTPLYQPIVDLATGAVIGYEGVSRLHPDIGTTPTTTLFRAARTLGLTHGLDRTCRHRVLHGAQELPEGSRLFLNVAAGVLQLWRFSTDELLRDLEEAGLEPERVVVEVTEHERSPHSDVLARHLRELRDAGIGIALDDLGSGGGDLDILGDLPFDFVKVDMVFIHGAIAQSHRRRLLHGLRLLVAETGAEAIAEGVETSEDVALVREIGFRAAQGFALGEPARDFRPAVTLRRAAP